MKLNIFKSFRISNKSILDKYITNRPFMQLIEEDGVKYLEIDKRVGSKDFTQLMKLLRDEKYEITFHDIVHPTISDPGAYFSYSTTKSHDDNHWSMTYGNHGWSGGIYQIKATTLERQILSLIKKEKLNRIQISNVIFFSHYDLKEQEENSSKDLEIQKMHTTMTTIEIINRISSHDSHQIWEASCEIISLAQETEIIKPLIPFVEQIKNLTKGIDLGGALAPNKRFLDGAIKTLEFHRDSKLCACNLYGIHECMNPNDEVKKGYLTIDNTVRIDGNWVDYYEAFCTRCNQKFQIEEREGHYMWWSCKKIN